MSAAVQTVDWVNAGLYTILAVGAYLQWRRGGGRPALWAALAFGAIGLVVIAGRMPERWQSDWIVKVELALLVLFPYLLYRFTTAFERAAQGLERFVGLMTGVLLAWSIALPRIPEDDEEWSTGFVVYLTAFLFHWSVLSIIAAVRLWRAGNRQPRLAQRRMRFLASAAALLTAALLLAGLGASENSPSRWRSACSLRSAESASSSASPLRSCCENDGGSRRSPGLARRSRTSCGRRLRRR